MFQSELGRPSALGRLKSKSNDLPLRILLTADISHHVVCCERLLDGNEEDRALYAKIIPHASHPGINNVGGIDI